MGFFVSGKGNFDLIPLFAFIAGLLRRLFLLYIVKGVNKLRLFLDFLFAFNKMKG
jgi:hypothetical protein